MLAVSLAALGITVSAGAGVATAAPATFNPSNAGMKWSGSITTKLNGGSAKTCTFPNPTQGMIFGGSVFSIEMLAEGGVMLNCGSGTILQWKPQGEAQYEGGAYRLYFEDLLSETKPGHASPYGPWNGGAVTVPYTNGAGATPSKITFSNTVIGALTKGGTITATGTVNVTTLAGGLLTLSK